MHLATPQKIDNNDLGLKRYLHAFMRIFYLSKCYSIHITYKKFKENFFLQTKGYCQKIVILHLAFCSTPANSLIFLSFPLPNDAAIEQTQLHKFFVYGLSLRARVFLQKIWKKVYWYLLAYVTMIYSQILNDGWDFKNFERPTHH